MRLKLFLLALICLCLFQGCAVEKQSIESSLRFYESSIEVENLFRSYEERFASITKLFCFRKEFFQNCDNGLMPGKKYNYREHFSKNEMQTIQDFIDLTGLYSISFEYADLGKGCDSEPYGIKQTFCFCMENRSTLCFVVNLSPPADKAITEKMIKEWYALYSHFNTVEMKELGGGWFLFTHYELPND